MSRVTQGMPVDGNNKPIPGSLVGTALAVTYSTSNSSAVNITLNTATTYIEVSAITKGVFLRFAATASSANFDEFINAETTRGFAIPAGVTVISVIEEAASAHIAVVEK